jgi:hypothetical protein
MLYWSHSVSPQGTKYLGVHGWYYMATNYLLNLVMVTVGFYHLALIRIASQFADLTKKYIDERSGELPSLLENEDKARNALASLSHVLVLSKVLIALFMLNALTWKSNEPNSHGALDISVLALFFLGTGYFAFPRYHIQYWLYQLWKQKEVNNYIDMRLPLATGISALADSILLGTTAIALFMDTLFYRAGVKSFDTWRDMIGDFLSSLKD